MKFPNASQHFGGTVRAHWDCASLTIFSSPRGGMFGAAAAFMERRAVSGDMSGAAAAAARWSGRHWQGCNVVSQVLAGERNQEAAVACESSTQMT